MDSHTYMLEEGLLSEMINFEMDTQVNTEANLLGRARDAITKRLGGGYGEVGLLLEVMMRAAKQGDTSYFDEGAFKHHCFLLGCDYTSLRDSIVSNIKSVRATKKLTADDLESIRGKYASAKYTRNQLAHEYGVGLHTIKGLLYVNNIKKPLQKDLANMSSSKVLAIMADLNSGLALSDVSRKHKVTKYVIYQFIEPKGCGKYIIKNKT